LQFLMANLIHELPGSKLITVDMKLEAKIWCEGMRRECLYLNGVTLGVLAFQQLSVPSNGPLELYTHINTPTHALGHAAEIANEQALNQCQR
jgi:hypothetical protein